MGASAGAHLALMVALTEDRDDLDPECGDEPPEVTFTLAYAPPTDLPTFSASESIAKGAPSPYVSEDCQTPVVGCTQGRAGTRCVDASPLAHACSVDDDPIVVLQAPDPSDPFVAQAQAEVLGAAIASNGGDITLFGPSYDVVRASGCTPETGSHASDACMLQASDPSATPG